MIAHDPFPPVLLAKVLSAGLIRNSIADPVRPVVARGIRPSAKVFGEGKGRWE